MSRFPRADEDDALAVIEEQRARDRDRAAQYNFYSLANSCGEVRDCHVWLHENQAAARNEALANHYKFGQQAQARRAAREHEAAEAKRNAALDYACACERAERLWQPRPSRSEFEPRPVPNHDGQHEFYWSLDVRQDGPQRQVSFSRWPEQWR